MAIYNEGEKVTNPFSGESYELTAEDIVKKVETIQQAQKQSGYCGCKCPDLAVQL